MTACLAVKLHIRGRNRLQLQVGFSTVATVQNRKFGYQFSRQGKYAELKEFNNNTGNWDNAGKIIFFRFKLWLLTGGAGHSENKMC